MKLSKLLKIAGIVAKNLPVAAAIVAAAKPVVREVKDELKKPKVKPAD